MLTRRHLNRFLAVILTTLGIGQALSAQEMSEKVVCDSTTILLYYIAAHDYGFAPTAVPAERYDKGQFTPLFDAMMSMEAESMDSDMGEMPMMAEPMDDGMMTMLTMPVLEGEAPECTCLRMELESFFAEKFGIAHSDSMMGGMESADAMGANMMGADSMMSMDDLPAWASLSLTNAITGEAFTIADFAGKTIYVEPFATWCSNCRTQLNNVNTARAQLGEDVVFIALSVETNLQPADLQAYQSQTGYNLTFAVATPELLAELVNNFGRTVANPPATPHFIIRPDGSISDLATGFRDSAAIIASVQAQ